MADIKWPMGLPCFTVAGYQRGGGDDGVKRSQFPAGAKSSPRHTAPPPEPVRASLVCNPAQLQTVLDFWAITCRRVLPFLMHDVTKPDDTLVEYAFLARPSYVPHGRIPNRWRVTLELEQRTTFQGTFPLGDGGGSLLGDGTGNTITT